MNKKPIGLFGGTFDPIHLGHLQIAQQLILDLNLEQLEFIPNRQSPLRNQPTASAEDRLAMIRLAIAHSPHFTVNDIEIRRPGLSYFIDTLKTLRAQIPNQPLCSIIGSDTFNNFNQWFAWQDIPNFTHIVIINRPNATLNNEIWMTQLLKKHLTSAVEDLHQQVAGKIYIKDISPINISASKIRQDITQSDDFAKLVPVDVYHYIQQHRLYR